MLPECLRGECQLWYSVELDEMAKDLLRSGPLDKWYEALIRRFKTRTPSALELLQKKRYNFNDARNGKHPHVYAQNILQSSWWFACTSQAPSLGSSAMAKPEPDKGKGRAVSTDPVPVTLVKSKSEPKIELPNG